MQFSVSVGYDRDQVPWTYSALLIYAAKQSIAFTSGSLQGYLDTPVDNSVTPNT